MIEAMCRLPLRSAPGDVLRYSNASYGVLARMAGTVSERPFWSLVRDRVFDPLGIVDFMEVPDGALWIASLTSRIRITLEPRLRRTTVPIGEVWRCRGVDCSVLRAMQYDLSRHFSHQDRDSLLNQRRH